MEPQPTQIRDIANDLRDAAMEGRVNSKVVFAEVTQKIIRGEELGSNERIMLQTGIKDNSGLTLDIRTNMEYDLRNSGNAQALDAYKKVMKEDALSVNSFTTQPVSLQEWKQSYDPAKGRLPAQDISADAVNMTLKGLNDRSAVETALLTKLNQGYELGSNEKGLLRQLVTPTGELLHDEQAYSLREKAEIMLMRRPVAYQREEVKQYFNEIVAGNESTVINGSISPPVRPATEENLFNQPEQADNTREKTVSSENQVSAAHSNGQTPESRQQQQEPVPESKIGPQPVGWTVAYEEKPGDLSEAGTKATRVEFRFNPVSHETPLNQPGGSDAEALKVGEQIQEKEYEILLPAEAEHLRSFLQNDGYLSNEELSSALYDASLTRNELGAKIDVIADQAQTNGHPEANPAIRQQLTDYLWDVHQTVMDSPFLEYLQPNTLYTLTALEMGPGQTKDLIAEALKAGTGRPGEKAPEGQPDQGAKGNRSGEETEAGEQAEKAKKGLLKELMSMRLMNGTMLGNLMHNHEKMETIILRVMGLKVNGPEDGIKNQAKQTTDKPMEVQTTTRWDYEQVRAQLEKNGVTKDFLQQSGNLEALLNGNRTGKLELTKNDGAGTLTPVKGQLYITEKPGLGPVVYLKAEKLNINPPKFFLNHELTDKDRKNLIKDGEMGRAVTLTDKVSGEKFKGYIGIDPAVNRLTVLRQERFKMPSVLKGAPLTEKQQQTILEGKQTRVNGMMGEDGKPFNAVVQISANSRSLKFKRIPEQAQRVKVTRQLHQTPDPVSKTSVTRQESQTATAIKPVPAQKKGEALKEQITPTATRQNNPAGESQKKKADDLIKTQQNQGEKTKTATVEKNGASRTTEDVTAKPGAPGQPRKPGESAKPSATPANEAEATKNGKTSTKAKQDLPKQGPKMKF